MPRSTELTRILEAGALLVHSERSAPTPDLAPAPDLKALTTAQEALSVVCRVQQILDDDRPDIPSSTSCGHKEDSPGEVSVVGTRDIAELRTLLSIVFKWGTELLLEAIQAAWPTKPHQPTQMGPRIVILTDTSEDYSRLSSMTNQLLGLLFPRGVHGPLPQTLITSVLLGRHVTDLLKPGITLGWVPKSLASEAMPVVDELRPLVMRLLSILPPSQTIASLGTILSSPSSLAPHVQKSCASLLSRQLLRPEGVRGLCAAVFGEGEVAEENPPLEKLEQVARVLSAIPSTVNREEYYRLIVPRVVAMMSSKPDIPPAYRRAAAFSISRMLAAERSSPNHITVSSVLLPILHDPFFRISSDPPPESQPPASACLVLTPRTALYVLQTFITNTDPSPTVISTVISPIVPALYSLLSILEQTKTADPALKEVVRGLLTTWGRIVEAQEVVAILSACIEDKGGDWTVDVAGELKRVERKDRIPSLSLFTPEDLKRAEESGDLNANANILNLRPDPNHFVRFVKSLDRADVFVRTICSPSGGLIIQMQSQLSSEGSASGNIFSKPEHILSFVKHALEAGAAAPTHIDKPVPGEKKKGLTMEDLRIVDDDETDVNDGQDSDDETPEMQGAPHDEEMIVTAINLLLSILEANPDLSASTSPIISDIVVHVDELTKHPSDTLRRLAREARMVLTVRLASSSNASASKQRQREGSEQNVQEIYQKALKLLQDPILPVRAHGLLLLRQIVAPPPSLTDRGPSSEVLPLVPAILDIFLQSVQDDDSYVFLNAVQGLSALVGGFGTEVLRSLVRVYTEGLQGVGASAIMLTNVELDTRVRVGEALGQVIRKCGDTLPIYADILVPPLFAVTRASHLPTALRTSALSLLAQCAETCDLALVPYAADLTEALLDLLQIESVLSQPKLPKTDATSTQSNGGNGAGQAERELRESVAAPHSEKSANRPPSMDTHPTSRNSKFPPLRRAALHFLALLVRAYTVRAYNDGEMGLGAALDFPVGRAKRTLGYVAVTDADDVVRVMAREVGEAVGGLERAIVGL
ncbi:hypothetical protein EW146_g2595 [Bondarzewia mesenterica]|uniref:Uncharacterized protein n=1 Tax=Bondarzewia mesenterica TaxID=1095465 RepID=A0A4V3XFQ1_9AGAM|nr:hypothetical protein EW146_g2595 [Bondarzewia mesenterica]